MDIKILREEGRRKRGEKWLIWSNWLCTDFTWPSANRFLFSFFTISSGQNLKKNINGSYYFKMNWYTFNVLDPWLLLSCTRSPSFRERRVTDRKIILILLVIWTCMCMLNHFAPGLHWLSVVLGFFPPHFFPFTSPLINNLLSPTSFQTRILSFVEHKVRSFCSFQYKKKVSKTFLETQKNCLKVSTNYIKAFRSGPCVWKLLGKQILQ